MSSQIDKLRDGSVMTFFSGVRGVVSSCVCVCVCVMVMAFSDTKLEKAKIVLGAQTSHDLRQTENILCQKLILFESESEREKRGKRERERE